MPHFCISYSRVKPVKPPLDCNPSKLMIGGLLMPAASGLWVSHTVYSLRNGETISVDVASSTGPPFER